MRVTSRALRGVKMGLPIGCESRLSSASGSSSPSFGEDRVRARDLQQRNRDALPVGDRRLLDRTPLRPRTQQPLRLARKAGLGRHAEAEVAEYRAHALGRHAQHDLGGADVRRLLDHLRDGEDAVRVGIVDGPAADGHDARPGVDRRVAGVTIPSSSAAAMVKGFIVEPGSKRSVTERLRVCAAGEVRAVVRVVVGHGSRARGSRRCGRRRSRARRPWRGAPATAALSSRCARNCRRSSIASVHFLAVARRVHALARPRRCCPLRSLDHLAAARRARQPRLLRELDAFLAVVVHAGEAHHVRHHLAGRVVAAVLALLEDARDAQRHHFGRAGRARSGA